MHRLAYPLTVALLVFGTAAHALTAAEVFAKARSAVYLIIVTSDEPGVVDVVAQGSAVLIAPGRFVTNCHVLARGKRFVISRREDKVIERVHLVNFERGKDLCELDLVQPRPGFDQPVAIAPPESLLIGAPVFAIGSPRGMELSLSTGIISGLRDSQGGMKLIQTTAPFSAGSSGGGLFDEQARLIGITTLIARDSQNLNFAVPAQYIVSAGLSATELSRQRSGIKADSAPEIAFERQERLRRGEQETIDARKKQLAQPRTSNPDKPLPQPAPSAPAVAQARKPLASRIALYEPIGDPGRPARIHEQLAKKGALAGLDDDAAIRKVYESLIRQHITEQLAWTEGGDHVAEFQVQLRRSGEIMFVLPLRPSGDERFDQEARRAIGAASPLPVPRDNEVFAQMSAMTIAVQAPAVNRPAPQKPAPQKPAPKVKPK